MTQKQPDILAVIRAAAIEVTITILKKTSIEKRRVSFPAWKKAVPASRYAERLGSGGCVEGERIIPLSEEEAREWAENHLTPEEYEKTFCNL